MDMEAALRSFMLPLLSSLQISSLITWGLQGIMCLQVYHYFLSFPKDPVYMKTVVYTAALIELLHTALVTHDAWEVFANNFGNMVSLNELNFLWFTLPILGAIAGFLCHITFAYRIFLLSESKIVGSIILLPTLFTGSTALAFGAKLHEAGTFAQAIETKHIYLICGLWNGGGAICDALIAGIMTYYLTRKNTGFRSTDFLINRIVHLSIETGIITATASIASVILFVGFRERLSVSVYFICPAMMITKLYAITILATFNNRPHTFGNPPSSSDIETYFDDTAKPFQTRTNIESTPSGKGIRIGRTVVQQVWKDDVPMSHLKMYEDDSAKSIKDDSDCLNNKRQSLTLTQGGQSS